MKKNIILTGLAIALLAVGHCALAARDWEYWSQGSISLPVNKSVSFLVLPEWKFKNDMHNVYLFKLETGPSFKINDYIEMAPYYVYQEKKSAGSWDKSDFAYLDGTVKLSFKNFSDLKLSNRFRYQYDFAKGKTTLRNSTKISKTLTMGQVELTPGQGICSILKKAKTTGPIPMSW